MVQQAPISEFDHDVRSKRVRSKSESVSDHAMVSTVLILVVLVCDNLTSFDAQHLLTTLPMFVRSMCVCVLCPRIDPLRFLAECHRRQLNQGLVVAVGFSVSVR